ncbi:MAG: exosortase/archaeosortase family protein [Planctomycetota bacterium]
MKKKTKIAAKVSAILLLGGFAVSTVYCSAFEGFHKTLSLAYARITELLVEALGLPVYADGSALYTVGAFIRITRDCNGVVPFVILVSASLLVSLPWKRRLALAAFLGTLIIVFNELRIVTFFLINTVNEKAADLFHDLFIPLFLFVIFAMLWLKWLQQEMRAGETDFPESKDPESKDPESKDRVVSGNALGVWERVSLGLAITLVALLLADLLLKGSGILPHCSKNGTLATYISILGLGLIGWLGVAVLLWKRKSTAAALLVGAFTGVHVALLGQLVVKSSFCTPCLTAAALSLLVFSTFAAQGHKRLLSFTALVIGIVVTQGLYFI